MIKKRLHVIMPMAGEGNRFKEVGIETPKPLLKVDGKEIFRRAVDSIFDFGEYTENIDYMGYGVEPQFTFIVRKDHIDEWHIDDIIHAYYPEAYVLYVEETTRGALETVMKAMPFMEENDVIMSMDCDFAFRFTYHLNHIKTMMGLGNICPPMLMTFYSKDPKYSFIVPSREPGIFSYAYEKKQVSSFAIAGCYLYGDYETFKKYSEKVARLYDNHMYDTKEMYASLYFTEVADELICMYDDLNFRRDMLWSFNTPEDFDKYDPRKSVWDK